MSQEMKITFMDAATVGDVPVLDTLNKYGEVDIHGSTKPAQTVDRLQDTTIAITNKVVIGRKEMKQLPKLQLICIAATGTNNIDLQAADEHGIAVRNVEGYSTDSVVEHTFGLLFALLRQLPYYSEYVHSGDYSKQALFTHHERPFWELKGKTFGIIGLGSIGQAVAAIAQAFGAKVVYYSTSGKHDHPHLERVSLDELLEQSAVVSIHAPLNKHTKGLIGAEALERINPEAILLNTGRGGIVDEAALVRALNAGQLRGAAFDVMTSEPLPEGHVFLNELEKPERLLLTPHNAWASKEARERLLHAIEEHIDQFIKEKRE